MPPHNNNNNNSRAGGEPSSKKPSKEEADRVAAAFFGGNKNKKNGTGTNTNTNTSTREGNSAMASGSNIHDAGSSSSKTGDEAVADFWGQSLQKAFTSAMPSGSTFHDLSAMPSGSAFRDFNPTATGMPSGSSFRDATAVGAGPAGSAMPSGSSFRDSTTRVKTAFKDPADIQRANLQMHISTMGARERQDQERWAQKKIADMALCPAGFAWARVDDIPFVQTGRVGGYVCHGGNHWMPDVLLAEGRGGCLGCVRGLPWVLYPDQEPTIWLPGIDPGVLGLLRAAGVF